MFPNSCKLYISSHGTGMRQCFYICSSLCVRLAAGVSPVRHTSKMLSPASWRWAWQSHDRLSVPGSEAVSASISPVLRGDLGSPGSCFQLNGNKDFFFLFFSRQSQFVAVVVL